MSRSGRRAEAANDNTTTSPAVSVGVNATDIEDIVAKAVSAATEVIRSEFMKLVNDIQQQLQSVDQRLTAIETSGLPGSSEKISLWIMRWTKYPRL